MDVNVTVSESLLARLKSAARREWDEDERDDRYFESVTQGNADDTYADGEEQGEASLAAELLNAWGISYADRQ